MCSRSLSLPAQLLVAFVGLVTGTTAVLTLFAYRSSLESLEIDARRSARVAAEERAETLARLFGSRQQRAEGFLAGAESLCAEPRADGRLGWSVDCVQTLMQEFRATERATRVEFRYRGYLLVRTQEGRRRAPVAMAPEVTGLARVEWSEEGTPRYVMRAERGDALLLTEFDNVEPAAFLADRSGLGDGGEVFLTDADGRFLTAARYESGTPAGAASTEPLARCRSGAGEEIAIDYRGVRTIHAYTPVPGIGGCVDAHFSYDEAMAPAEQLRTELTLRGLWFALAGALLSLFAAHWISAPVRRLMHAARTIEAGQFDRPVPVGGPTEVRALGAALSAMADALARMVAREQSARQEAERANRSKDEFLATVSHELRTPLTAIVGWARLMRDARLDPQATTRAIAAIERNAQSQRRLVEDLLDVSRITRGELHFDRTVVPLVTAIDAALESVSPQAAEKGVAIERAIEDAGVTVLGDGQRLQQIVWNLAWNAVKFTDPGGKVRVGLRKAGTEVELSVSDTGVGIANEFLPHVFDWFRQADPSPTRSHGGLGVGLGLVRQLVEMHGGRVRAESAGFGLGASFIVSLPMHGSGARPIAGRKLLAAAPVMPADLHNLRVLVVDDDQESVDAVRAVLQHAGAVVDTAVSADEARRELAAAAPDVLISDLAMPREDGYAFVQSLRQAQVTIPAIALTAYARREDAERALAAGFQVHLSKPVDPGHLVDTVAHLARPA